MQLATNTYPLRNIGLALSGGGFRAASFALGSMSYMYQLQWEGRTLLEHVNFISSTSGGSIANAFYTLRLHQGYAIPKIFSELYEKLHGDDILERALATLTTDAAWKKYPHKTRNLINAFAITYDRKLYDGKTFAEFWDRTHQPHVGMTCFNATELNNGISFRFKTDGTDTGITQFGNHYLHFKKDAVPVLKSVRIADVVAASSCFPSGFEPIVYPQDFAAGKFQPSDLMDALHIDHNNDVDKAYVAHQPFGLMDGGIVDNQGLYGLRVEDDARRKAAAILSESEREGGVHAEPFDLMIHCDVASYFVAAYQVPMEFKSPVLKIRLKWLLLALGLILPLTVSTVLTFASQGQPWYYYFLISPAYFSSGLIGIGIYLGTKLWLRNQTSIPTKMFRRYLREILNLPISAFVMLARSRIKSFSMLAQDVFLKQIRRLHLEIAYNDARNENRIVSNFIYELSKAHHDRRQKGWQEKGKDWPPEFKQRMEPSEKMEKEAETARNVGTTLWFDPKHRHELDSVVATGQFTMCYNLLKYITRLEKLHGALDSDLITLRDKMLQDWDKFQEDPKWMLKAFKKA